MILKEISVDGGCYFDYGEIEARFALNKDEVYFINENNNTIYSLGIGKTATKEKNNMNKKDIKVIFNDPVTILYMNGKKYISKAHDEEFDEEKGLLMCLAKANGISHLELKRMIKNAERQNTHKVLSKKDMLHVSGDNFDYVTWKEQYGIKMTLDEEVEKLKETISDKKRRGRPRKVREIKGGDKVRVLKSIEDDILEIKNMIGKVCEVKEFSEKENRFAVWQPDKEDWWWFTAEELELIEE